MAPGIGAYGRGKYYELIFENLANYYEFRPYFTCFSDKKVLNYNTYNSNQAD